MNIHIFINIEIKSQANALLSISWLAMINMLAEPAQLCLAAFIPGQEKCGCQTIHTSQKTAVFRTGLTNWYSQQWHSAPSASLGHKHINTWYFCGANFRHSNGRSHGNYTYIFHSTEEAQLFLFPLLHKQVSCSFNCMWKKLAQEVSPGTPEIEVIRFL